MAWRFLLVNYGRVTWSRLLYALLAGPLALLGFGYLAGTALLIGLLVVVISPLPLVLGGVLGVLVLAPAILLGCAGFWLRGARILAGLHRRLADVLLDAPVPTPQRFRRGRGVRGWFKAALSDAVGWRSVLYLLAKIPLGAAVFGGTVLTWGGGMVALTYPLWADTVVVTTPSGRPQRGIINPPEVLLLAGVGLVVLLAAPWITRVLVLPDALLARKLLGPTRTSELRQARTQVLDDAADRLRRIERDLHDGTQAQLVALAMQLGMAKEELAAGDGAAALSLVDRAHRNAKLAIIELRDLTRGIHPPALDSGLEPALHTLATRSPVPVELAVDLPRRPARSIETIAYFTAAELLANVAKHSGASRAEVSVARARPGWLLLTVRDDGTGGARLGGGLAGLADRAGTVDGRLLVDSPAGGPTVIRVELPENP